MKTTQFEFVLIFFLCFYPLITSAQVTSIWQTTVPDVDNFSSPRATDLNGDGILDIVTGGGLEDEIRSNGTTAFDGATGEILWSVSGRDQMYGSAQFMDITNDGVDDVFICGRQAEFRAINGATGELIWEFYTRDTPPEDEGLFNFYNPQFIPDQNGDGVMDLLNANGGDRSAGPLDTIRPPGHLFIISGADGQQLAKAQVPDGHETYMSPIVHDFEGNGTWSVLFGTGGETIEGSLWRTTIADVMNGDLSQAIQVLDGIDKGFLAPPSLADLNIDGIMDIVVAAYGKTIATFNGLDNSELWEVQLDGTENVAAPAIGLFTDDLVPDIFHITAKGLAPTFIEFYSMMINGATGEIAYIDTLPNFSMIAPVAFDYDGDGRDEGLFFANSPFSQGAPFTHELMLVDFATQTREAIIMPMGGTNLGATPWVGDLENDGDLELVYTYDLSMLMPVSGTGFVVDCLDLNVPTPEHISWGSYQGTAFDGQYRNPMAACLIFQPVIDSENPSCNNVMDGSIDIEVSAGQPPYVVTFNGVSFPPSNSVNISYTGLRAGSYEIMITDANNCVVGKTVEFINPDVLTLDIQVSEPATNTSNGSATAMVTGGSGDYTFLWSNGATTSSINNLPADEYTVTISDSYGCTLIETVGVSVTVGIESTLIDESFFHIYPNPNNGQFRINIVDNEQFTLYDIQIFNGIGQLLQTVNTPTEWIDLRSFGSGIYFIQLVQNGKSYRQKLVTY